MKAMKALIVIRTLLSQQNPHNIHFNCVALHLFWYLV